MKRKSQSNVTFVTTAVLKRVTWKHMLNQFMKEKKSFKCDICDYSCSQKGTMKRHGVLVHEEKKRFKCNICDYACAKKYNITRHVARKHEAKKLWCLGIHLFKIQNFVKYIESLQNIFVIIPSKMYEHNILERESISDVRYSFSFLFPAVSKVLTNSLDHERNLSVKKSWSYTGPSYTYL